MKIVKRDGSLVEYDRSRIERAIGKALGETDESIEWGKYEEMIGEIEGNISDGMSVEEISDEVEKGLMRAGLCDSAKRYILYRSEHSKRRQQGWEMTDLQRDILENKYMNDGESFDDFVKRVSNGNHDIYKMIYNKKGLPAGRILAGRGMDEEGKKMTLSNCFVLPPVEDSIESIFDTAKNMAKTFAWGGGVGLRVSGLRPRGTVVNNAAKTTTGAVSFMDLYSVVGDIIGQNNRRSATMLSMRVDHPDIEEFIDVKTDLNRVTKANISVEVTDEFMNAVKNNEEFTTFFIMEDGTRIEKQYNARYLFNKLAKNNWDYSEPGILYQSRIDSDHLMSEHPDFAYVGTNPCAGPYSAL